MENEKIDLGTIMKKFRLNKGYTQQKVADYLHIDRTTYNRYENGREPELDIINALANLYEVSLENFIFGIDTSASQMELAAGSTKTDEYFDDNFPMLTDDEKMFLEYFSSIIRKDVLFLFMKKLAVEDAVKYDKEKEDNLEKMMQEQDEEGL